MRTWSWMDTSTWGPGPWRHEPDKCQWVDEATGLDCLIVRNWSGALCGYVGVSAGHPLFGVAYDVCPQGCETWCDHAPEAILDVHGGITFSDYCQEDAADGRGICHMPEPGRPERVYWFGFDTAHGGDLAPKLDADLRLSGIHARVRRQMGLSEAAYAALHHDQYRDLAYVQAQCQQLAAQLAALIPVR